MIKLRFHEKGIDKSFVKIIFRKQKESHLLEMSDGRKGLVIGIGEPEKVNHRKAMLIARQIIFLSKSSRVKKIELNFSDFSFPAFTFSPEERAEMLATNFEMANFEFIKYRTPPEEGWSFVEEVLITGSISESIKESFRTGQLIGDRINIARTLANTPAGELTPDGFVNETKRLLRGTRIRLRVFKKKELERLGMEGVLRVGSGSRNEPRFIELRYIPAGPISERVVLVGKGVTFDSGGLNLKPGDAITDMHMDMSGAAAVVSAIRIASDLKIKKEIIGLIPLVENMTSGSSYHPGDIIRSACGKTIEILNTDAEGRIILADTLCYAKRFKPSFVIDVATLTGAATVALGQRAMAIFSNKEEVIEKVKRLGETSGDYVWPLPLWEEYEEDIKGTFGDIANIGKTRYGGAITGATFLYQFIKDLDVPWFHIDMAPRMTSIEGEYLSKGASGAPVRLLIKILKEY